MKKEIDMPSRSRDRILSLISVLEYLRKEGKICDEKGIEMTGSYWDGIKKDIASKCHGNLSRGNDPNKPNGLLSVLFRSWCFLDSNDLFTKLYLSTLMIEYTRSPVIGGSTTGLGDI